MVALQAKGRPAPDRARSFYDYVGSQLDRLIPRFGLEASGLQIRQTYETVCRESLGFPLGTRPADFSRINQDGTPFQYSVTLGSPHRALQFIGEAGRPGLSGRERLQANRKCLASVASCLDLTGELAQVSGLLDRMAPGANPDLLTDPAGAYWIGAAFPSGSDPRLKIYTNAAWGHDRDRWARLRLFAAHFGAREAWQALEGRLAPDLKPLGTAITLGRGKPPAGRVYLSTYGKHIAYFEALAECVAGGDFKRALHQYAEHILGDDLPYPAQTTVCSFGLGAAGALDLKVEFCGHCHFASDVQAASRLRSWVDSAGLEGGDYEDLLEILSQGRLSEAAAEVHSFAGFGMKAGAPYGSVYLKPVLLPSDDS